jgi:PAS domain S-box-containing protein
MPDRNRTKEELIHDVKVLQERLSELESSESQHKQAEINLLRRTFELQSIFRAFPDLLFRLDGDGTILDYHAGQTSYLYVSPEMFLGKQMRDVLPPPVGKLFDEAQLEVLATNTMVGIEYALPMPQGEQDYEARLLPLVENQIIVIVRNITDQKKVEKALRESERKYRTLFEESKDSIFISTREDQFLDINRAALDLFGYTKEEMMKLNAQEIYVHPTERINFQQEVEQKGSVRDYEVKLRGKDGKEMTCLLTAVVWRADHGNVLGYQTLIRDITHRRMAEHEIKKLNDDLKRRTVALEASNKELEAFSYSVSHDLRTPLIAIGGFSRLLLEKYAPSLDEKGQGFLNKIYSNSKQMLQLIDDLLAFSRFGHQEIKVMGIDMGQMARAVFEELKLLDSERSLQLKVQPLPSAQGDPAMIRQVFSNLLSNAVKFTRPMGSGVIEVGGTVQESQNIYYVKDNGIGFDMKQATKLFSVFERLQAADEFEGTGIGLAIVQRIIHRHGGWVWAEGKVNGGATFYFTLPREKYLG